MSNNRKLKIGDMAADKITAVLGSWTFILTQSTILLLWIAVNVFAWVERWDPYPFILLNLALSFQASYAAPIIMMSQNREASRDRKKAEMDLKTDIKAEKEVAAIQSHLMRLEKDKLDRILEILEKK